MSIDVEQVEIRRFDRNDDFTAYFTEETIQTPETLTLRGREAVMIVADFGKGVAEESRINEIVCYGDKTRVPLKKASFEIKVPQDKPIEYAQLRVALTRSSEAVREPIILRNGKILSVPLESCADRLSQGECGTTKLVDLDPTDLQAVNTVSIPFPDGDEGYVGTAVIRAAVKQ